jgi:hypothetical protein
VGLHSPRFCRVGPDEFLIGGLRDRLSQPTLAEGFYGMLAQGFTRNTFVCAEGCSLAPVDDGGRFFYCPPNSAANAHFLSMLRHLLVQDRDLNDDGRPETLRLLFATPRRWLEDGQTIKGKFTVRWLVVRG